MIQDQLVRSQKPTRIPTQIGCRVRHNLHPPSPRRIAAPPSCSQPTGTAVPSTKRTSTTSPIANAWPTAIGTKARKTAPRDRRALFYQLIGNVDTKLMREFVSRAVDTQLEVSSVFMPTKLVRELRMSRIVVCFPVFACFIAFPACSSSTSELSLQQIAAYSVATGFLTLCDDSDYRGALALYAGPIKSHPERATWVTRIQARRGPFGLPIGRYWVNRQGLNESSKTTFQFRTSFTSAPLVDEVVSVAKISGRWQVYDYQFHALGKHPSPFPTPTPKPKPSSRRSPPGESGSPSPERSPSEPPLPASSP